MIRCNPFPPINISQYELKDSKAFLFCMPTRDFAKSGLTFLAGVRDNRLQNIVITLDKVPPPSFPAESIARGDVFTNLSVQTKS